MNLLLAQNRSKSYQIQINIKDSQWSPVFFYLFTFLILFEADSYNAKGRRPNENLEEEFDDDEMEEEFLELDKVVKHGNNGMEEDEENVRIISKRLKLFLRAMFLWM